MYVFELTIAKRYALMQAAREELSRHGYEGMRLFAELEVVAESRVEDLEDLIDIRPYK